MIDYSLIERVRKKYDAKDKEELKTYKPKQIRLIKISIGTRQQGKEMYRICKMLEYIEREEG